MVGGLCLQGGVGRGRRDGDGLIECLLAGVRELEGLV